MKINTKRVSAFMILMLHLLSVFIIFFYSHNKVDQMSLIVEFLILVVLIILNRRTFKDNMLILALSVNATSLIITAFTHSGYGFMILFANLILLFCLLNNISVTKREFSYIHLFTALFLSAYIATAEIVPSHGLVYVTGALGYSINSNMFALFTLACMMHWYAFFEMSSMNKIFKPLCAFVVTVVGLYLILLSGCRSVLISLVIFTILFFSVKKTINLKPYRKAVSLIMFGSLIFAVLYMVIYWNFDNIIIFGKSLFSGRQIVWDSAFSHIREFPIFGSGTDIPLNTVNSGFTESAHHTLIGVWKCAGIIPVVSIIFLIGKKKDLGSGVITSRVAQLAFISCLVLAYFESFLTEHYLYILFSSFALSAVEKDKGGAHEYEGNSLLLVWR
ncbi:MAG: O-antigen ligase family protein [Clostridia bacterium]|nr:O-antigen ligase family protein [Clostridia bacterium]